ncbi:hypothetical protein Ddye_006585 [Dipteronia dyeriana]|uniref:DUF676 domain-containing protein n=1 Tax=Dipteronia dyeriana TaxID=168575 RepID=A0AAD9XIM9_9ROSI|nr:hypothetical protein Ddye_006585 [Dipteronia dyeriana]
MASVEVNGGSGSVAESEDGGLDKGKSGTMMTTTTTKKEKKKSPKSSYMRTLSCLMTEEDGKGNFDMEVEADVGGDSTTTMTTPTHLVVMVNGIIGSAHNWKYAAKQFLRKYPKDVIVHCSECNSSLLTFDGVDVMGDRLADEVLSVVKRHPGVQKISFIGHSLGGLIARYAIARLYKRDVTGELPQGNGECRNNESGDQCLKEKFKGKIAGLEPVNFITSASPHLGSRGHKQVPAFCGFHTLEKVAARSSWFLGRTGKHLFLTDNDEGKPPLLVQMASDGGDLKFISALQSFRHRVAYANARFDHFVGWSTSSLRRSNELPKRKNLKGYGKYPHIANVETAKNATTQRKVLLGTILNGSKTMELEDISVSLLFSTIVEEMLRGLTTVSWERVDVYFRGSKQRFLAHNTIQVKTYCINSDGADVIEHMIDNFLL